MNEDWIIYYKERGLDESKKYTASGILDAIQLFSKSHNIGTIKKIERLT